MMSYFLRYYPVTPIPNSKSSEKLKQKKKILAKPSLLKALTDFDVTKAQLNSYEYYKTSKAENSQMNYEISDDDFGGGRGGSLQ